jgi:hypothetical protein
MNTKEKAKQLVDNFIDKMFYIRDGYNSSEVFYAAKQCALIAVDEILWEIIKYADNSKEYVTENAKYWQEVKSEIEKL